MSGKTARKKRQKDKKRLENKKRQEYKKRQKNKKRQENKSRGGSAFCLKFPSKPSMSSGPTLVGVMKDDFSSGTALPGMSWNLLQAASAQMEWAVKGYNTRDVAVALLDVGDGTTRAIVGVIPDNGSGKFRIAISYSFGMDICETRQMKNLVDMAGGLIYISLESGRNTAVPKTHEYILSNFDHIMTLAKAHSATADEDIPLVA